MPTERGKTAPERAERPLGHRLAWFAGLAAASLAVTAATAYLLRAILLAAS